jgi:acetyltransferase-like isoleucine patch superfamily enzyme
MNTNVLKSAWWMVRLHFDAWRSGGSVEMGARVRLRTRVIFRGRGNLKIGEDAVLGDGDAGMPCAPIYLAARGTDSSISIGARTRMTNGAEVIALKRIGIGEECSIGAGVRIVDADFHGAAPEDHAMTSGAGAVSIGGGTFIGTGAMILKRVRIGDFAVIAAGAVVARDVEDGGMVGGNPAKVISTWRAAAG